MAYVLIKVNNARHGTFIKKNIFLKLETKRKKKRVLCFTPHLLMIATGLRPKFRTRNFMQVCS